MRRSAIRPYPPTIKKVRRGKSERRAASDPDRGVGASRDLKAPGKPCLASLYALKQLDHVRLDIEHQVGMRLDLDERLGIGEVVGKGFQPLIG